MYSLSISERLHHRKNTWGALESWKIQIYTHSDLHCLGNRIYQPNKSTQVRRLKKKQHRTDVYHNGLINRLFVCKTMVTKHT